MKFFSVLKCCEEFHIEYCQQVTNVAYTITIIDATIYCYIITLIIINSLLEYSAHCK